MRMISDWLYHRKRNQLIKKYGEDRVVMAEIRSHFAAFGHDTSDMTDEQIRAGVRRIGKLFGNTGISVEQANKNLQTAFSQPLLK